MGNGIPSQTPLHYANNANRYMRQEWITKAEEISKRKIIIYVSNFNHPLSAIVRDDIVPFCDILSDVQDDDVDLVIHSPGGDPNAAEQMVNILLGKTKSLRVIIPLSAKSAGTMISLAADEILMSDSSELGPIDPQVPVRQPNGLIDFRPAKAFLKGLEDIKLDSINGLNPVYYPILQNIDAAFINFCQQAITHTRNIAEKWLSRSMCKNDLTKAKNISEILLDIEKYPNHGQVIDWKEAKTIGLNVTYTPPSDSYWQLIWRLVVFYQSELRNNQLVKIFESKTFSTSV